jgi:hypothetical protein
MNNIPQPETPAQAREWDKTKNHYRRLGLCHRCAAQGAYGHADGFSTVQVPCTECLPIVAILPTSQPNGWRSQSRRRGKAFSAAVRAPAGR